MREVELDGQDSEAEEVRRHFAVRLERDTAFLEEARRRHNLARTQVQDRMRRANRKQRRALQAAFATVEQSFAEVERRTLGNIEKMRGFIEHGTMPEATDDFARLVAEALED